MSEQKNKLLEVKDLKVSFFTPAGEVKAVGGISYDLDYGEVMGVVGVNIENRFRVGYNPNLAEISSIFLIGFTAFSAISASTFISGDSFFRQS